MTKKRVIYPISEAGHKIGEHHHRAKLSDAQVDLIRDLYETGQTSYRQLAKQFWVDRGTIRDIVTFRRRATTIHDFRSELLDTTAIVPDDLP